MSDKQKKGCGSLRSMAVVRFSSIYCATELMFLFGVLRVNDNYYLTMVVIWSWMSLASVACMLYLL